MSRFSINIQRFKKSKNAHTLAENFVALSVLKVFAFLFPLITMPYLARVIGTDGFGAIAFAMSIMIFVETIIDWGFGYTATRDVAKCREDINQVSQIYSEVIFAKLILMTGCFMLLCLALLFVPSLHDYRLLLLLTFAYIPGHVFFPEWMFQAFEKMKYITILNVFSKFVFTVLIFLIIKQKSDYVYQPLLTACGYIVSAFIAQYLLFKKFKVRLFIPKYSRIIGKMKESSDMFVSLLMPNLYNNLSTIILKSSCGDSATGIYSAGQKFEQLSEQLSGVLSRSFFPFLSRHNEKHHIYVLISGCVSIFMCILLMSFAEIFIYFFYTPDFDSATTVIRILSLSPFFLFLSNAYGPNYLVITGKEKIYRNIICVCSILGSIISFIITPLWGYIGAAISVTVTRGMIGVSTWKNAKKIQLYQNN